MCSKHSNHDNGHAKKKRHFPMMLCLLIPVVIVLFTIYGGQGSSRGGLFSFLMMAVCIGSHFFMHGRHKPDEKSCCAPSEEEKSTHKLLEP